jgi:hypothetical protein
LPCFLGDPSVHPFADAGAFKLGKRAEELHLQLAGAGRHVDGLAERDKGDAALRPVVQDFDQVLQGAAKPIQLPDNDGINLPAAGSLHQFIQRGAARLAAADASIHEFACDGPATGRAVRPQFEDLVLGRLVIRADAGVEGDAGRGWSACRSLNC